MFPYAEPVTVLTAGTVTDPYSGEPTGENWDNATERAESCGVADGGSTEPLTDARDPVDSDFDLIFDHDPGITAANRVVVRGLTCYVVGRPFSWRSPFTGWEPGTVVRVSIREG
jgi:hypothetical protein